MLRVLRRHCHLLSTCILLSLLSISIIFLRPFLEIPIPHKSIEHVRNDVQIHRRRGLFPVDFPARIVCTMDEGCSMRRPLRWHGPRRCWNRKVRGWMCRRHGVRVDRRICAVGMLMRGGKCSTRYSEASEWSRGIATYERSYLACRTPCFQRAVGRFGRGRVGLHAANACTAGKGRPPAALGA